MAEGGMQLIVLELTKVKQRTLTINHHRSGSCRIRQVDNIIATKGEFEESLTT